MGNSSRKLHKGNTIERDSKTIDDLLLAAKNGQWDHVWQILDIADNSRFFNVIPENRRWGILHQAVYWNRKDVIQKLLTYEACDTDTKVKQCTLKSSETSALTALNIAESYDYPDMIAALSEHENKIDKQDVPTLQPYDSYNDSEGLGLISLTLSAYKNTFHPEPIDSEKDIVALLGDIFNAIMKSKDRWKAIKEKVFDSVYVVCVEHANTLKDCKTPHEFFENIIKTYTTEQNRLYTYLNLAFRRQKSQNYRPSGRDLAMGPYAVIYQMLLLYWRDLSRESQITYRCMSLTTKDEKQYSVGKRFVWQSVVSSSINMSSAAPFPTCGPVGYQSVMFTIDNKANSMWKSRNIAKYAIYHEFERTFPAGAKFVVTKRERKDTDIHVFLELLPE